MINHENIKSNAEQKGKSIENSLKMGPMYVPDFV